MALDTSLLFLLAPEFTADARAATVLALAEQSHTASAWGAVYPQAMAYYAAHRLAMAGSPTASPPPGGGAGYLAGPTTARAAGDVSESYGAVAVSGLRAGDAELMQTPYGRAYLQLRSSRAATAPRIITPTEGP